MNRKKNINIHTIYLLQFTKGEKSAHFFTPVNKLLYLISNIFFLLISRRDSFAAALYSNLQFLLTAFVNLKL